MSVRSFCLSVEVLFFRVFFRHVTARWTIFIDTGKQPQNIKTCLKLSVIIIIITPRLDRFCKHKAADGWDYCYYFNCESGEIPHIKYETGGSQKSWQWKLRGHKETMHSLAGDNAWDGMGAAGWGGGDCLDLEYYMYMYVSFSSVLLPKSLPEVMVWKCIVNVSVSQPTVWWPSQRVPYLMLP